MSPRTKPVKATRRYDASGRREQARQARERIVRTAEHHFLRDGYVATSVAAIAAASEVSVDTIYKGFGGKPGLIHAIFDRALEGEGTIPAEQRSDRLQAEETDPRKIIAGWGSFVAEISPRGSPILLLVRDAATTDPELRTLLDEVDAARLRRMRVNAKRLHDAGHLRAGISVSNAADVLWTYSSAELYDLLVIRRRMPVRRFGEFVAAAMIAALL
jgi:AcrR family transcriptional regulator